VGRVTRALPIVLGAAAVAGLLVAVWPDGGRAPEGGISAILYPRAPLFGDQVVARIAAPAGATVDAGFAPYTVRSRTLRGGTRTYRLECLSLACLPGKNGLRLVRLPSAVVRLPTGAPVAIAWPTLRVGSRLDPGDAQRPVFRADLTPPHPSSRLDPDTVGWGLASGAGVLLIAAAGWTARRTRPRTMLQLVPDLEPELSPLEDALAALEQALGGPVERRRAALDSLALAVDDPELAARVQALAWSPEPPATPAMRQVAEEARRRAA
jgi:hypothetical protein